MRVWGRCSRAMGTGTASPSLRSRSVALTAEGFGWFTRLMADQSNYFRRPTPSLRHSMPYVVELFDGSDEVTFTTTGRETTAKVFERGVVRLTGELAAYDGAPLPLGMRSDGEEWDVVFVAVKGDGSTGIGVCRRGASPVYAVSGGQFDVNSGTVCITTMEQVMADGRLAFPDSSPWILSGSVSESVRIGNGYGDGAADIICLFDAMGEACGAFVGDVFESNAWVERILPGEQIMSTKDLQEALEYGGGTEHGLMPIVVYNERHEFVGYLRDYDLGDVLVLMTDASTRPADSERGPR